MAQKYKEEVWDTRKLGQNPEKRTEKYTEDAKLLAMKTLAVLPVFDQLSPLSEY